MYRCRTAPVPDMPSVQCLYTVTGLNILSMLDQWFGVGLEAYQKSPHRAVSTSTLCLPEARSQLRNRTWTQSPK